MSHYKPYPAYRDSGVEWIGQVPEHWAECSLKHALAEMGSGGTPDTDNPLYWCGKTNGTPWIAISDMSSTEFVDDCQKAVTQAGIESKRLKVFPQGTLLFSMYASLGHVAELGMAATTNQAILGLVPTAETNQRFMKRWLQSLQPHLVADANNTTQDNLNAEKVRNLPFIKAPLIEQQRIATQVDLEVARIDALITKKTRFIELLKEKRQALITHVVTKGLNSDAPIRNSGVDWLGDIPAHWLVAQLGKVSIARCDGPFGSGLKSEHYQANGVRVIRLQNIGWASFKDGNEAFISHQHWQDVLGCGHEVLPNDVLIGGLGDDKNPLGRACVAPSTLGPALVKADCYRFRLNTNLANPNFIALALSATARAECGYLATGATRDRLNLGLASARVLPLPPLNEQAEIVESLNRDTARIDLLTEKTQRSIDLLKERRSAFITAAVTGQIDLREAA